MVSYLLQLLKTIITIFSFVCEDLHQPTQSFSRKRRHSASEHHSQRKWARCWLCAFATHVRWWMRTTIKRFMIERKMNKTQFRKFMHFMENEGNHTKLTNELRFILLPKANLTPDVTSDSGVIHMQKESPANVFGSFCDGSYLFAKGLT